jgi:hypothetical protein
VYGLRRILRRSSSAVVASTEKATASKHDAGQASTDDGAGDGRHLTHTQRTAVRVKYADTSLRIAERTTREAGPQAATMDTPC